MSRNLKESEAYRYNITADEEHLMEENPGKNDENAKMTKTALVSIGVDFSFEGFENEQYHRVGIGHFIHRFERDLVLTGELPAPEFLLEGTSISITWEKWILDALNITIEHIRDCLLWLEEEYPNDAFYILRGYNTA